ncbi:MAG: hypothetical protein PHE27_06075, partial [Alphaproteobacteria bacterium]|nr:hypothetical protein [Alphaproteobacteria bacterium]
AAVPPEGTVSPRLTSLRVEKLVAFGAAGQAWALAKQADQRLVSDSARRAAALNAFLGGDEAVCGQVADSFKIRSSRDWQKLMIVCRLQARDNKAAQVALDILRSENGRDKLFLSVADRNILGSSKTLPAALSPTDPEVLALLQMTGLGLPESFFARADLSDARALLRVPARDDAVRLRLAERAAERGLIGAADLESVYRAAKFPDAAFAAPLASAEKEARLRALLFQAADRQKDPVQKTALVAAFVRSASAPFLNGAGDVVARMLGDVAADPSMAKDAAVLARVYMLSGAKAARDWVDLARDNALCADEMRRFWPQFVLAGLVKDRAYASDFSKWFSASMKVSDARAVRESIAPTLLLLDASGREVPDAAWQAVYDAAGGEEKISLSPLLFERMLAASAAHRRAETVLMAAVLTKGTEVSLTASIGVVSALREAGLETEAAAFARETAAVLALEK